MNITLTRNGVTTAVSLHPENTTRKAVSLVRKDLASLRIPVASLGGAELSLEQIATQFQAHWTLTRKESGPKASNPSQRGPYASKYSDAIVAETKAILDRYGIRKVAK